MSPILLTGTIIVNLALISYTIGIIMEQRSHVVSPRVLTFLTIGVVLDVTATVCMIWGSTQSPFSLHGILGYSSLTGMVVETTLAWRHWLRAGEGTVSRGLHLYSRAAYTWWVLAYITGALLVALR
ncbi:MAG: hypothetical protein KKA42_16280 [candidate division Zixibacteria bacterium]|nr:hypothetical protein [candidate division Zixibacteria bacterium]